MSGGRGLPTSGTISLRDILKGWKAGSYLTANTFNTPGYGTIVAPSGATWVRIEVYGGGGGGCGYGGTESGGGGGGYAAVELPVTGGVSSFGYLVGTRGLGGAIGASGQTGTFSYANGIPGVFATDAIYAGGGGGGTSVDGGNGGSAEYDFVPYTGSTSHVKGAETEFGTAGGTGVYYYGGDAGGASGGAGGTTSGAAGTAPGGGGAGGYLFNNTGGAGANGRVAFIWYSQPTGSLRDMIAGGTYVENGAAGLSENIPRSGTISIRQFLGADELGFYANNYPYNYPFYYFYDSDSVESPLDAYASATMAANTLGGMTGQQVGKWGKWLSKIFDASSQNLSSRFQVQFTKTATVGGGASVTGSAVNTWLTISTGPSWFLGVEQLSLGDNTAYANGYLRFRRVSDSVECVNVAVSMKAYAQVIKEQDTK